jgi:SAM-dependent methyltransferase
MTDPRAVWEQEAADAYDRGRPAPPSDLIRSVLGQIGISQEDRVLDLAAGTGKLTREIAPLVNEVIAVEPSLAMLSILRHGLPDIDARSGRAENIPLPNGSVGVVFVADAFHWFDVHAALAEIHRVLRPDGRLVLVWYRQLWWDAKAFPWIEEFDELLRPLWEASIQRAGPHPNVTKQWRDDLSRSTLFGPFSTLSVGFCDVLSTEQFVSLVASFSWVSMSPAAQRTAALEAVHDLVAPMGELTLPYRTDFDHARRPASRSPGVC